VASNLRNSVRTTRDRYVLRRARSFRRLVLARALRLVVPNRRSRACERYRGQTNQDVLGVQCGLDYMQIVDARRINACQGLSKKIGLLLVVAFEANAVTRRDHRFEQGLGVLGRHQLSARIALGRIQASLPVVALFLPVGHGFLPNRTGP
jgi:hypothetical protein